MLLAAWFISARSVLLKESFHVFCCVLSLVFVVVKACFAYFVLVRYFDFDVLLFANYANKNFPFPFSS